MSIHYFTVIFLALLLASCGSGSNKTTPAPAQPSPVKLEDCQNQMKVTNLPSLDDNALSRAMAQGRTQAESSFLGGCAALILPAGFYSGHLVDGQSCAVTVEHRANKYSVTLLVGRHPDTIMFSFHVNPGAKSATLVKSFTASRLTYQTLDLNSAAERGAYINQLSVQYGAERIKSIYLYNESHTDNQLASADCRLSPPATSR